ncbi:MAG: hypothetical protein U0556_08760 [Dehalococcoidia bacterium]
MIEIARRLWRPVAAAIVLLFVTVYLVRNWDQFSSAATMMSPAAMVSAVAFGVLYWLSLAAAWWRVQAGLGGGLAFWPAVRVWSISTVARYVPGNIWHLAGRTALARDAGGDGLATLTASIYEQVLTLGGAFIAAGVLLPLAGAGREYLLAVVALPVGLLTLHPVVQRWIVHRAARALGRMPPQVLEPKRLAALLGLYVLPNLPAGLALVALGGPAGPTPVGAVGGFAFAWAVGFLSIVTPSGLGVREAVLAGLLTAGLGGADPLALAIGHRLALTAAEIVVAGGAVAGRRLAARVL